MEHLVLASALTILSPHFCLDRALIADSLREKYQEEPQTPILVDQNLALQFYRGPRSWTLTSVTPDGMTCVIAAGEGWQLSKS
jgi:hypothetical protein